MILKWTPFLAIILGAGLLTVGVPQSAEAQDGSRIGNIIRGAERIINQIERMDDDNRVPPRYPPPSPYDNRQYPDRYDRWNSGPQYGPYRPDYRTNRPDYRSDYRYDGRPLPPGHDRNRDGIDDHRHGHGPQRVVIDQTAIRLTDEVRSLSGQVRQEADRFLNSRDADNVSIYAQRTSAYATQLRNMAASGQMHTGQARATAENLQRTAHSLEESADRLEDRTDDGSSRRADAVAERIEELASQLDDRVHDLVDRVRR